METIKKYKIKKRTLDKDTGYTNNGISLSYLMNDKILYYTHTTSLLVTKYTVIAMVLGYDSFWCYRRLYCS